MNAIRYSKLKLEENAVNVVLVTDKDTGEDFFNNVLSRMKSLSVKLRKVKFVVYVLTDIEKPLFLEKVRSILMNNVVFTITIRGLRRDLLDELIRDISGRGETVYVIVDKKLVDKGLFTPPASVTGFELI